MSLNIGGAATASRIAGGAGGSSLETTEELFRAGKEFPEEVGAESVREGAGKAREGVLHLVGVLKNLGFSTLTCVSRH